MGAIDLVIQIEAPPSIASGLQRIGRANHQVGAVSRGVVFPKFRGDLLACAAATERMRQGLVEASSYPRNPLDVLAQQLVAMVASGEELPIRDAFETLRRAAPFRDLPQKSFDGVLNMLSRSVPVRPIRGPSAPHHLGSPAKNAEPSTRSQAGRGDQRRDHSRSGALRECSLRMAVAPSLGGSGEPRRRDGPRIHSRRRDHPGEHFLAHRRDRPRPGAGEPGPWRTRAASVLAGRSTRATGGIRPSHRSLGGQPS